MTTQINNIAESTAMGLGRQRRARPEGTLLPESEVLMPYMKLATLGAMKTE
ncbi:MAG: hypothetical protein ACFB2Y_23645 [Fulvivirga sp.]